MSADDSDGQELGKIWVKQWMKHWMKCRPAQRAGHVEQLGVGVHVHGEVEGGVNEQIIRRIDISYSPESHELA